MVLYRWHETDMPKRLGNVRYWMNSGKHMLALSFSGFDPTRTYALATAGLKVGDIVALSPSHPFTTFDKWRLIWEIDDNYNVVGTIETFS